MDTRKSVDLIVLITSLSFVLLLLIISKLAQTLKLDPDGRLYDSTVDKLCGQFVADQDIHLYMQGLSHGYDEQFYLVYHDHVYSWLNSENFGSKVDSLWAIRYVDSDTLKPLGAWNEIAWIKSILDANGIDGSGVKLTRLWIDTSLASGPRRTQIEISFQASGQAQVDTLIATNETRVTELRKDYVPECMVSNKHEGLTYIFRYDNKQRVVVMMRHQSYYEKALKEEGPLYMHRETGGYRVYLKFYPSPPDHYTPLFTQLPIYGFISNAKVHLWDLPNHLVYYFDIPMSLTEFVSHEVLKNVSFEKYFDCPNESPSSSPPVGPGAPSNYPEKESESILKDGQTSTSAQAQTGGQPLEDESNSQVVSTESNQSNGLLYFALALGLIVLLLAIIWIIARRIIKRKRKKKRSGNKSKKMKKSAGKGSSKVVSSASKSSISFSSSSSTNKTSKTASSAFTSSRALKSKVTPKTSHIRVSK